jgi:hypothetical protein
MIRSLMRGAVLVTIFCSLLSPATAADTPPEFDLSSSSITLSVAPCGWDCALTAWFAPDVRQTFASVSITNKSKTPIHLAVAFDASGAYPAAWESSVAACVQDLGKAATTCSKDAHGATLPVAGRARLRIEVDANGLAPGKYGGTLLITGTAAEAAPPAAGEASPAQTTKIVALTGRVRADAALVLLAVLAGVVGGRLFKQITAQDAVQQMALYGRYLRLKNAPPLDASDPLSPWWNNQLDTIKNQLDQSAPDTTAITASLKRLEDTATLMHSISSMRAFVNNLPSSDARRPKVVAELQSALSAIVQGNLDQAKARYDSAVTDAFAVAATAPPVVAALSTIAPTVTASFAALNAAASTTQTVVSKARAGVISALNWISGDSSVPVEVAYSYVRPIMTLALVAVLAVYGMWQNYSGSDDVAATFGAQGIASYTIMFLWGFSSQVVASTLQTLKFDRPTTPARP